MSSCSHSSEFIQVVSPALLGNTIDRQHIKFDPEGIQIEQYIYNKIKTNIRLNDKGENKYSKFRYYAFWSYPFLLCLRGEE